MGVPALPEKLKTISLGPVETQPVVNGILSYACHSCSSLRAPWKEGLTPPHPHLAKHQEGHPGKRNSLWVA